MSAVETIATVADAEQIEALFATCKRRLTDGQIANLFGERMTAVVNERDELRHKVAQLEGALAIGQENCDAAYDDLRAERDQARANEMAALHLVARIREALGDHGKRMQDELIEYCRELASMRADKDLLMDRWKDEQAKRIAAEARPAINWTPVERELPDADITVLIGCSDGDAYQGSYDGGEAAERDGWLFETPSAPLPGVRVTCWAEMPAVPEVVR